MFSALFTVVMEVNTATESIEMAIVGGMTTVGDAGVGAEAVVAAVVGVETTGGLTGGGLAFCDEPAHHVSFCS